MFPPKYTLSNEFFINSLIRVVVVVLPFDPVTPIIFTDLSRNEYAISTSFITFIPSSFAFTTTGLSYLIPGFLIT